jgi:hypothetical protein
MHRFVIHGKSYGIAYAGGMNFANDPHQVCLADFHFRTRERFFYEYNFHVPWRHEIRVEQIVAQSQATLPVCGPRATPRKGVTVHTPFLPCASTTIHTT